MTILFITKYLNDDLPALVRELYIVLIPLFAVFVAMIIDLIFGLYKAKESGEVRTSYGLRRTVRKFIEYYSMLILAFVIDVLASIIDNYNLPYITFIAAAYLVFTEILSIREKASDKERRRQNRDLQILIGLVENKGDLLKSITSFVKKQLEEEKSNDKLNSNTDE